MAHISGLAAFVLIVVFVAVLGGAAWVIFTHLRARRLGLPQPTLQSYNPFNRGSSGGGYGSSGSSSGGVAGWVKDKINGFKNRNNRSAGGAYEAPLNNNARGRQTRGFGPLDPDEAWDTRVGTEAEVYGPGSYYEEQELGLHGNSARGLAPTPGQAPPGYGETRGRSLSRDPEPYTGASQAGLGRRHDEEMGGRPTENPFDDHHAEPSNVSLRGVSPRPMENVGQSARKESMDSPGERRSMFRENM